MGMLVFDFIRDNALNVLFESAFRKTVIIQFFALPPDNNKDMHGTFATRFPRFLAAFVPFGTFATM